MESKQKVALWFRVFGIIAILWNIFGLLVYLGQAFIDAKDLEAMSEVERNTFLETPAWAYAGFALGVFGGLIGSVLLFLRKKSAYILLWLSMFGIIITEVYNFIFIDAIELYGYTPVILEMIILFFGISLILVYHKAKTKGWIIN